MRGPRFCNLLPSCLAAYRVSLAGGIVEDEVSLSVVDDHRHVGTTAPGVCHDAIGAYRIGSREERRLHVVTVHSYEKLCSEISLPVEGEAPHCCKVPDTDDRPLCM